MVHIRQLWQHAKNKGFDLYSDGTSIHLYVNGTLKLARSFPWNPAGLKAARAWLDKATDIQHEQTIAQPATHPPKRRRFLWLK